MTDVLFYFVSFYFCLYQWLSFHSCFHAQITQKEVLFGNHNPTWFFYEENTDKVLQPKGWQYVSTYKITPGFFSISNRVKPVMLEYSEELYIKNIGMTLRRSSDEGFFKRIVTHLYFWIFVAAMHIIHVLMCYEVCAILINIIYNKCIYYHKNVMCVTSYLGTRRIVIAVG